MSAETVIFNDTSERKWIRVSIGDNYVALSLYKDKSPFVELSLEEGMRMGKFLTSRIFLGDVKEEKEVKE